MQKSLVTTSSFRVSICFAGAHSQREILRSCLQGCLGTHTLFCDVNEGVPNHEVYSLTPRPLLPRNLCGNLIHSLACLTLGSAMRTPKYHCLNIMHLYPRIAEHSKNWETQITKIQFSYLNKVYNKNIGKHCNKTCSFTKWLYTHRKTILLFFLFSPEDRAQCPGVDKSHPLSSFQQLLACCSIRPVHTWHPSVCTAVYVYKDTGHIGLGTSYRPQLPTVIISEDPVSKRDLSWGFSLQHMSLENTVWSLSQEKAGPRSPKVHNGELCKKAMTGCIPGPPSAGWPQKWTGIRIP